MEAWTDKLFEGDCLDIMPAIPDKSVDMVLCDLPYGTTQNKWDCLIDLQLLWRQYRRIIKPHAAVVLTGQGLFTGCLIMSNPEWYKYKIVWIKSKATNFLNANKQPLRKHEDICVFYQKQPRYDPQKTPGQPYDKGIRGDNRSDNYGSFHKALIRNLSGDRYPTDVLFLDDQIPDYMHFRDALYDGIYHPTQKPVDLGRWLIRTYSRPGDIILDNTCGSGSFLVAAVTEGRHFIGIEKNDRSFHMGKQVDFIAICRHRIAKARNDQGKLFPNE